MARPRSQFLSSLGIMLQIWKALVDEVLSRGGTDDDLRRIETDLALRAQLAQLIITRPKVVKSNFTLYLHNKQKNGGWIKGFDLDTYLKEEGLLNRCFSLEDEVVKGWLADSSTYPEEFKGKAVFLWRSQRASGGDRNVACLIWSDGQVIVRWDWLGDDWHGYNPVLLASS